jgi:hypothetical protein
LTTLDKYNTLRIIEHNQCVIHNRKVLSALENLVNDQEHLIRLAEMGFFSENLIRKNKEIQDNLKKVLMCK